MKCVKMIQLCKYVFQLVYTKHEVVLTINW